MLGTIPAARQRIIERIVQRIPPAARKKHALDVRAFVRAYYRGVAEEDLRERNTHDLAGAALAHLQFGSMRHARRALVRVYTPQTTHDGWSSPHTVIETVTDDMPFLVDSLQLVLMTMQLAVHLTVHPVIRVRRDRKGRLLTIATEPTEQRGEFAESWQRIEIDRVASESQCREIAHRLAAVLEDVRLACGDWQAMRHKTLAIRDELSQAPLRQRNASASARAFLEWMVDDHFTFLGYQEYRLERRGAHEYLKHEMGTALGLQRSKHRSGHRTTQPIADELKQQLRDSESLLISKAPTLATVHRATYPDQISVKRFDSRGRVVGEHRILGLFTSSAYNVSPRDIPLLSDKVNKVVDTFGLAPASHDAKAVLHVLETYPRDELFQSSVHELLHTVRGIVNLYERHRVRLFVRRDTFRRFYSCLLYVPRDRYNTQVRERIEALILQALQGTELESQVQLSDSVLARLHVLVRSRPNTEHHVNVEALEAEIAAAVRTWRDRLRDALIAKHGEAQGLELAKQYAQAFPAAYQDEVSIAESLQDIEQLAGMERDPDGMALRLVRDPNRTLRLRILRKNSPLALSDALPLLENMDFRVLSERPYKIELAGERATWIQDCEIEYRGTGNFDPTEIGARFRDAFMAVWQERCENDGFNRLVLAAGLSWREVSVLRAYCRYLLQTGVPFSQAYMERTLARYPKLARILWTLFVTRFDPTLRESRAKVSDRLRRQMESALQDVASLDEDRILRAYLAVIGASVRTNYFQEIDGAPKEYLAIKLSSRDIPDLPLPKPLFEIFVYAPRFEGIHLRNGHVARGGIRWSDRREDFRTEVLGLMKAQNVKNTVIVPVGAKGGFVPKRLSRNASREDIQREGIECYRAFIRGLLDLTDNLVGGAVVAPQAVVRHDGDDPYLVVAADKGTATFSDIANRIAAEYGFWLGDAFASGGSAGYDHKGIAITARGAWESVQRHFRELGIDTQTQDFTVAGIGDMSGDVFGNGMLRSKHIRLLAAFDHRNVFLDPAPDAAVSFRERTRLFKLPRSSWEDYDRKLISRGGGIFSRSAKSVRLSPAVQAMLGIKAETMTPQTLVQAILRMPVDLLWNGGIGTYVKAHTESQVAVGDRGNDAVRVNGRELRCRVVGEGGNLGFTQLGRIEYALAGGRINTDFIDNSAGVDCSDHEVNIKILLNAALEKKQLDTPKRNKLLRSMTDAVAALVLRDNYLQTQALSIAEAVATRQLDEHAHLMRSLELSGELNRTLEFLPTAEELTERAQNGRGLTRPELSVLLAYSKIALYTRLIESDVPEDPYLGRELERYFPSILQRKFARLLPKHRLRREIIATATTNSLVNRMGPSFARSVQEDTGANAATVARAYTIAREIYGARDVWARIEALDARPITEVQQQMHRAVIDLLEFATYWLLRRHAERLNIDNQVQRLQPGVTHLREHLPQLLCGPQRERYTATFDTLKTQGVSEALAQHIASLDPLYSAPDIVEVADLAKLEIERVAAVYFAIGAQLGLDWLRSQASRLESLGHWQSVALGTLRDSTYSLQRTLCAQVLGRRRKGSVNAVIERWLAERRTAADAATQTLAEMRTLTNADFATLSVALQAVRRLTEV